MSGGGYTESQKHPIIERQWSTHNSTGEKEDQRSELSFFCSRPSRLKTMFRLFNCWIFVSVLLRGPAALTSNASTQDELLNVTEEDTGWDSPFLQLRANLPSYSQPIRPYALPTNSEDYHHMPESRHRRPSRLLRILGSSFDPFWMSIDQPSVTSGVLTLEGDQDDGQPLSLSTKLPNYTALREKVNLSASSDLREATAHRRLKLEEEAADLDFGFLPPDVASSVSAWLVRSAACGLRYQWVDLGAAYWPRWLRQTDCERSDGGRSCSFPRGMDCRRAQTMHLKILAWHCLEIREGGDGSRRIKADWSDGSTEMGTSEAVRRCLWRQVPYPVVTACTCSCK